MGKRRQGGKQKGFFVLLLGMLIVSITFFVLYETRVRPIITTVASASARTIATSIINDELNAVIASKSINYGDLVMLQMDAQNRIAAVCANAQEINRLKAEVAFAVQNKMKEMDMMVVRIPLGTFLSDGFITGYGPKIPIKITTVGRATVSVEDSFFAAGINQTRHEIHLSVTAKISVLIPGGTEGTEVQTTVPVAQAVIVGEVPQSYTNVEGVSGTPQDNLLNMIE